MIRDITDIFNRNLIYILGLSLAVVIPYTFFILSAINYFYIVDTIEYQNLIAIFLIVMNFTALFPPFYYLAKSDLQDTTVKWTDLIKTFLRNFGLITFFTALFFIIGMVGSVLFFIPTILSIIIIFLLPLFCDQTSIRKVFHNIWGVIKKEHIFILLDIIIIVSLNLLIWSGSMFLLSSFENNSLVFVAVRVLLNALFLPVIYFYLTIKYRKDLGESIWEIR
jgi:hypothetical protein